MTYGEEDAHTQNTWPVFDALPLCWWIVVVHLHNKHCYAALKYQLESQWDTKIDIGVEKQSGEKT